MKKALILFAKVPRPGYVKTRLQPDLSADEAGRLYRAFLLDTLQVTAPIKGVTRVMGCDPNSEDPFFQELSEAHGLVLINQSGEDLGSRMQNAMGEVRQMGFSQTVIIGTDSPTLPTGYIEEAFSLLQRFPVVLGPSTDGGYYLIGFSGDPPPIFDGIAWGTQEVLTQTIEKINENRIKAELLPFWYDVDTIQDLRFLERHLAYIRNRTGKSPAPETERLLKVLKLT